MYLVDRGLLVAASTRHNTSYQSGLRLRLALIFSRLAGFDFPQPAALETFTFDYLLKRFIPGGLEHARE